MSTWIDIAKTPGYLSFGYVLYQASRGWWTRRYRVAIGPAVELRAALLDARRSLSDIIAEPRRTDWFLDEGRREVGERLQDLADRVNDRTLRILALEAAGSWSNAFANAPAPRAPSAGSMGQPRSPQDLARSSEELPRFEKQVDEARAGVEAVNSALARLNKFETKTIA